MSHADSQALCLLSACEAGMVTMQGKGLGAQDLADLVDEALAAINQAFAAWPKIDAKSRKRAFAWLTTWVESQEKDTEYPAHRAMVAASQQAVADLYGRLRHPRKMAAIEPLFPVLAKVEDWFSSQRDAFEHYEAAGRVLQDLYDIMAFEP